MTHVVYPVNVPGLLSPHLLPTTIGESFSFYIIYVITILYYIIIIIIIIIMIMITIIEKKHTEDLYDSYNQKYCDNYILFF